MRHRDPAIDAQAFDLIKHGVVRRVGRVTAKDPARCDHAHRRAASLHRVNLHRRRLRAQSETIGSVERVLRIARGMSFQNIECIEVVEVRLDLAIVFDGITQRDENILDALPHQCYRV